MERGSRRRRRPVTPSGRGRWHRRSDTERSTPMTFPSHYLLQAADAPASPSAMHPVWIVAIIVVSAVPAFFLLHLVITTLMLGKDYQFPIKLASHGPRYCPHCGKEIAARQSPTAAEKPPVKLPA